jgi:hypothetical protein
MIGPHLPKPSMKPLALIAATLVVAFTTSADPIVQVRDVPNAPNVVIVGWDPESAEYGLRTRLRRDGSHVGEGRVGEHRLFLSSVFVTANGGFAHAVAHTGKLLRTTSTARDMEACQFGSVCTPSRTVGLGVSDELLRENRDSLVVTLRPATGRNWTIRLDRPVIDAYLATMDSVSASLKKAK